MFEEETESGDDERASGDRSSSGKPKWGCYRMDGVSGVDISQEVVKWGEAEAPGRDYDFIAFEKPVSFVAG